MVVSQGEYIRACVYVWLYFIDCVLFYIKIRPPPKKKSEDAQQMSFVFSASIPLVWAGGGGPIDGRGGGRDCKSSIEPLTLMLSW